VATHWDSNNMVSTTQGKSAHSQSVKLNVTPASDVIALLSRCSFLRESMGLINSHAPLTEAALSQCVWEKWLTRAKTETSLRRGRRHAGSVHAPRRQAQGVCWDVRGPHSR